MPTYCVILVNKAEKAVTATDSIKSPRGIRGFKLNVGNFTEWRVQGKIGGYRKYVFHPVCNNNEGIKWLLQLS